MTFKNEGEPARPQHTATSTDEGATASARTNPVAPEPLDQIAIDIFKQYHLNHTDPKFLLGQKVRLVSDPDETGRVIGYFTSVQMPDGIVIDTTQGLAYVAPDKIEAVGA